MERKDPLLKNGSIFHFNWYLGEFRFISTYSYIPEHKLDRKQYSFCSCLVWWDLSVLQAGAFLCFISSQVGRSVGWFPFWYSSRLYVYHVLVLVLHVCIAHGLQKKLLGSWHSGGKTLFIYVPTKTRYAALSLLLYTHLFYGLVYVVR